MHAGRILTLAPVVVLSIVLGSVATAQPTTSRKARRMTPVVRALQMAGPAVVNISTEQVVVRQDPFYDFTRRFFHDAMPQRPRYQRFRVASLGSGVLIDPRGYILTNEHVVRRASTIKISLPDKTEYKARRVSEIVLYDLALLKIDDPKGRSFPHLAIGTTADVMIGETVIAVGNPFGYTSTVTRGILSATDREIGSQGQAVYEDLLQTDGAINPGNSGGPLLNVLGELIGLNTAIRSEAQGIGFAIPAVRIRENLPVLFNYRRIGGVAVGCTFKEQMVERAGELHSEVTVDKVAEGGPADRAGLRTGQTVRLPGHEGLVAVLATLLESKPGDEVKLLVDDRPVTLTLARAELPDARKLLMDLFGLGVQELDERLAAQFRVEAHTGLAVNMVQPGSPAEQATLASGDILAGIGNRRVRRMEDLGEALEDIQPGQRVRVMVLRNRRLYSLTLTARKQP